MSPDGGGAGGDRGGRPGGERHDAVPGRRSSSRWPSSPASWAQFLSSFGLTMACAIMVSLLVGVHPHADAVLALPAAREQQRTPSREAWFFRPIDRGYTAVLRWSMRHRWLIVAAAAALTIASIPLLGRFVGTSFMPEDERGDFEVNIKTPPGWSLARTDAVVARDRAAGPADARRRSI